jgi:hypothetical protein
LAPTIRGKRVAGVLVALWDVARVLYRLLDAWGNVDFALAKIKGTVVEQALTVGGIWLDVVLLAAAGVLLAWPFWPRGPVDPGSGDLGTAHTSGHGSTAVGVNKGIIRQTVNPLPPETPYSGVLQAEGVIFDPRSAEPIKLQIGQGAILQWGTEWADFFDSARHHWGNNKLLLERINGELKVTMVVRSPRTGMVIAELVRNEWEAARKPVAWDRNFSKDALEVKDETGDVVLQLRVLADRIQLQGKWHLGIRDWIWPDGERYSGPAVMVLIHPAPDAKGSIITPITSAEDAQRHRIEPIFEYPSSTKLGQLRAAAGS